MEADNRGFMPNWRKLGLKSKEEGLAHILSYLKQQEKHIAAVGFGQTVVKVGNVELTLGKKRTSPQKKTKDGKRSEG